MKSKVKSQKLKNVGCCDGHDNLSYIIIQIADTVTHHILKVKSKKFESNSTPSSPSSPSPFRGITKIAQTPILSSYPTNHLLCMTLRLVSYEFIDKNCQLFRSNFASHKKVL